MNVKPEFSESSEDCINLSVVGDSVCDSRPARAAVKEMILKKYGYLLTDEQRQYYQADGNGTSRK